MKIWAFFLLISCVWAQDSQEESPESILHQIFSPTAFGIKSRTTDDKDATNIIAHIKAFILTHPQAVISRVEIITCSSDYELPHMIVAEKRPDEHVVLAWRRHEMIESKLKKIFPYPVKGEARICGPKFRKEDLNDRFVVKESGEIYEQKFKLLLSDPEFIQKLKEEALIEDIESLKSIYPSPFLAKFKPFQGIRLTIFGHEKLARKEEIDPKQPSGRNQ